MFTKDFYITNRKKLSNNLPNRLIIISANSLMQSSADNAYKFRQDSNFWYLTGINEPDFVLIIDTNNNSSSILLPFQNEYQSKWDGKFNNNEYEKICGINNYQLLDELPNIVKKAKKSGIKIAYLKPLDEFVQPYGFYSNPSRSRVAKLIHKYENQPEDIRLEIARLRQIKHKNEIDAIQTAINITGKSLNKIKKRINSFETEKEVEKALSAEFYTNGGDGHGFEPIIASGKNATIIHYNKNNSKISKGNLLLLDVGALNGMYSADISRTWSISGATKRQKEIHKLVLELQSKAYHLLKPGILLKDYQTQIENESKKVLKKIGISQKKYPHGVSHFLGIDVHDVGDYSKPIQENNVLTVEPGVYLDDEGIGVRIEDVVLVTKNGVEIMSKSIQSEL